MIVAVAAIAVANLFFALQSFKVLLGWDKEIALDDRDGGEPPPSISIVVPARNEERDIEACVRSLLAQDHPDCEVVIVDDRSEDQTRAILERLRSENARLKIVEGSVLPDGWVGKPWACEQGARAADGRWLLFTDADTVHERHSARSAQCHAIRANLDVLSLLTEQQVVSPAERIFLPAIFFTILLGSGDELFNGQYLLFSREAYDAVGGHAAVGDKLAEDLEFAKLFKREGRFRTALLGANGVARTRMYRSLGEIWRGFVKNFAPGSEGRMTEAVAGFTFVACVSPISPLLAIALLAMHAWIPAALVLASLAAVLAVAEWGMHRMRLPAGSALWLPAGFVLEIGIFVTSLVAYSSRRGVEWRGRRYSQGP